MSPIVFGISDLITKGAHLGSATGSKARTQSLNETVRVIDVHPVARL